MRAVGYFFHAFSSDPPVFETRRKVFSENRRFPPLLPTPRAGSGQSLLPRAFPCRQSPVSLWGPGEVCAPAPSHQHPQGSFCRTRPTGDGNTARLFAGTSRGARCPLQSHITAASTTFVCPWQYVNALF